MKRPPTPPELPGSDLKIHTLYRIRDYLEEIHAWLLEIYEEKKNDQTS